MDVRIYEWNDEVVLDLETLSYNSFVFGNGAKIINN
jgi:hypothetical protein